MNNLWAAAGLGCGYLSEEVSSPIRRLFGTSVSAAEACRLRFARL